MVAAVRRRGERERRDREAERRGKEFALGLPKIIFVILFVLYGRVSIDFFF